jgi:hypothetical protein
MPRSKKADALDLLKPDYKHVGKHRARRTGKDRLASLLALALASAVLSGGGYFGFQAAVRSMATPAPTKNVVNGIDLATPITVIDGSGTRKFAMRVGQTLQNAKLVVPYSRTLDITFPKSSIDIQKEEYRALALRIQKIIGVLPIQVKTDAKYPIEVRLGVNFELKE